MLCVEVKNGNLLPNRFNNKLRKIAWPGGLFVGALDKDGKQEYDK